MKRVKGLDASDDEASARTELQRQCTVAETRRRTGGVECRGDSVRTASGDDVGEAGEVAAGNLRRDYDRSGGNGIDAICRRLGQR